jgi:hypothetical protein
MAWYPEAIKKNINPGPNDPPIKVIGAILHIASGESRSLFDYFNGPSKGIESHFYVRREGYPEQYRDTHFEADANLKANAFIAKDGTRCGYVSIETQGMDRGEWDEHELVEIKRLLLWLSQTHDFPLVKCETPTSPGVGYHTLFGAPGPWTPVAKTCPGPDRVRQFNNLLVPWMASENGELDLITDDDADRIADKVLAKIEPRLKAYTLDLKKYEAQTDGPDAERAAQATVKALKADQAKAAK